MSGIDYFVKGFSLIQVKGLKRFVIIPLTVNFGLFALAFYYLFNEIGSSIDWLLGMIPDWLSWLTDALMFLLWPLALITVLVVFALVFNTIANLIAAPFNGLLAEKVEQHLTGQTIDGNLLDLLKDVPRMLGRELTKLAYYLPRLIGFFLLLMILPVIGQVAWFLFGAWMMAIQYCDYPFDNHKVPFKQMRAQLGQRSGLSITFGATVSVFAMVPIVNFLVMPVAVCGATAMWVDHYRYGRTDSN